MYLVQGSKQLCSRMCVRRDIAAVAISYAWVLSFLNTWVAQWPPRSDVVASPCCHISSSLRCTEATCRENERLSQRVFALSQLMINSLSPRMSAMSFGPNGHGEGVCRHTTGSSKTTLFRFPIFPAASAASRIFFSASVRSCVPASLALSKVSYTNVFSPVFHVCEAAANNRHSNP